jgi:hypothetical protein
MRYFGARWAVGLAVIAGALLSAINPQDAVGQRSRDFSTIGGTDPGDGDVKSLPLGLTSANPRVISAQVRLAVELEQRALERLSNGADDLPAITKLVYDSYVYVRFAISGAREAKSRSKYGNPLLQLQDDMMEEARGSLRSCLTELGRTEVGAAERTLAAEYLQAALARLGAVLDLSP